VGTQPAQESALQQAPARPGIRASDADRDRTVTLLTAAFAEGRLTADEHGQRLDAAHAALTWGQLAQLTHDLPGPRATAVDPTAAAMGPTATAMERIAVPKAFAVPDWCMVCLLLILCPPAGIAWLLLARGHRRASLARGHGGCSTPEQDSEHAEDR
jgi:hypothetical protein